jgi:hypothetical protein
LPTENEESTMALVPYAVGCLVGWAPMLLPLDATPSPHPEYPQQSSGIASDLVGGFFAVGLLMLLYYLLNLKPKRHEPYEGPND